MNDNYTGKCKCDERQSSTHFIKESDIWTTVPFIEVSQSEASSSSDTDLCALRILLTV